MSWHVATARVLLAFIALGIVLPIVREVRFNRWKRRIEAARVRLDYKSTK